MKKKLISRVAAAVGMCAAVAVVIPAVSVLNMFRSVSIAAEPSDVSSSSEAASESADAWDQLLTDASNSEFASVIELVAEEKAALEEAAASEEAAESASASSEATAESASASSTSADNNSSSAASSSKAAAEASSIKQTAAQEPTASHPAASSSSSSAPTPQLAQYLLQMEKLQKKFQSQLYSVICDAYDEYMEYPAEKHSLGLKVSIVVSKGGKLTSMQSACDKEFNALLSEMRTCLRENGRDQSLADNAQKAYESAKASMVKELKNVVYNTAVGNGSGASWIQSHRNMA